MTVRDLKTILEQRKPHFAAVIPKGTIDPERFFRLALLAATRQPELAQCDIKSVILSLMDAAALGLDPSGLLGQAYLVPFRDSKTGTYRAQLIVGYRGYITLAMKDGIVEDIQGHCVYAQDKFHLQYGVNPYLEHVPNYSAPREDKDIIGAYAVAWLKNGRVHFHFVSRKRIDAIRARSRAKDSGPWVTDFPEMCIKTAIRAIMKTLHIPLESATGKAVAFEESSEYNDQPVYVTQLQDDALLPSIEEQKQGEQARKLRNKLRAKEEPSEEPAEETKPEVIIEWTDEPA